MRSHCDNQPLHFVMVPFMCPGHLIPMAEIAQVVAQRGVTITIFTTPINANRIRQVITRALQSGLPITITELDFPSAKAGLPSGCESVDMVPSSEAATKLMAALSLLQQPLEEKMECLRPSPSCLISDRYMTFTHKVASKFGIPRISFDGMNCFSTVCSHHIMASDVLKGVEETDQPFVVPGVPDRVEISRGQLSEALNPRGNNPVLAKMLVERQEAEFATFGVLVNSFEELEEKYVKEYRKLKDGNVWCIGPLSSYNRTGNDKGRRGREEDDISKKCMEWLDQQEAKSVVYACFGSLIRLTAHQLMEIGLGLEATGRPFLWAVGKYGAEGLEKVISENGFEERVKNKGLVVRGWVPQKHILSHESIAAFVTHNGWNSTLEGISAGVPMICCPLFAEQFFNEKLIVELVGAGFGVVPKCALQFCEEEKSGLVVKREEIKEGVEKALGEGEESVRIRGKAKELTKVANRVVEEGGSSFINVGLLIDSIRQHLKISN